MQTGLEPNSSRRRSRCASQQAHIVFDDCRTPAENLIGEEGDDFRMLAGFFNAGRVSVSAQAIGLTAAVIKKE